VAGTLVEPRERAQRFGFLGRRVTQRCTQRTGGVPGVPSCVYSRSISPTSAPSRSRSVVTSASRS
jgi:hypothetical protein